MANTRFNYDECRTKKYLQQSTGPGRYILNAPGNGLNPTYTDEPQVRLQKWENLEKYLVVILLILIVN